MSEIKLKKLPKELLNYVLSLQKLEKEKKKMNQFSQELTIIKIIREHRDANLK